MSLELNNVLGMSKPVNTFYVSLRVPAGAPSFISPVLLGEIEPALSAAEGRGF